MPTLTVTLRDLPAVLKRLPLDDKRAIVRGMHATLSTDAHRWIQWAIKGGGYTAPAGPARKAPRPSAAKRKKPGTIAKVRRLIKMLFRKRAKVPRPLHVKSGCAPRPVPAYRQPVDTGEYKSSWKHALDKEGGTFYSASRPPVKAGVIEYGRRRAPIPIEPLADWVRRKLGCNDPKKARSIAYAISIHASKHKRPGLYVLERAHPKIVAALQKNVEKELRRSIADISKAARL